MKKMQKMLTGIHLSQFIILLMLIFPSSLKAQTSSVISENWMMIGESSSMIEVSARIIKCASNSTSQIHLEIFNEGSTDQTAHFKVTLTNSLTNKQKLYEISLAVLQGAIVKPDCGNNKYPSLRLNMPAGWDPATVQVALTFISKN